MTKWLTDDEQRTWRAWLDMNRLVSTATDRQLLQDAGMPAAYYAILVVLSEAPDRRMRMSALAEATDGSQSRLSHAVSRLEDRGWVERLRCSSDGRGWYAVLTDEGAKALAEAAPGHVACVRDSLFDVLDPEQQRALRDIAVTVADHLRPKLDCRASTTPC